VFRRLYGPTSPSGIHFLRSGRVAAELIRRAEINPGCTVLDLGAGTGALTGQLAATDARVIAVERDPDLIRTLKRRAIDWPNVRIVADDILGIPLPRRPFFVVANPPFNITTAMLGRLLDGPTSTLRQANLIVALPAARRLTAPRPDRLRTLWWRTRYQFRLHGRIPATAFSPPPSVSAAHLAISPNGILDRSGAQHALWQLISLAHRNPRLRLTDVIRRWLSPSASRQVLKSLNLHPAILAAALLPEQWAHLTVDITTAYPEIRWARFRSPWR